MADNDPNRVWPSGLTTREAEELHDGLKQGTRIFGAIAIIATSSRSSTLPGFTKRSTP